MAVPIQGPIGSEDHIGLKDFSQIRGMYATVMKSETVGIDIHEIELALVNKYESSFWRQRKE